MGSSQSRVSQPMRLREALSKLSDMLVPSEEYYRTCNIAANDIFNILRQYRDDVDRVIIGGSMGKRTAISTEDISEAGYSTPPDLDIVVFLNYKKPPFRKVLDEFKETFREVDNIVVRHSCDEHFICIDYEGYKIDISPATNLRNGMIQNLLELRIGDTQQVKIMEIIENSNYNEKTIRAYSSGLAEYAVGFVKNESAFAHALIRLAKFWNSKIQMKGYVLARSYLIECVTIHAYPQTGKNDIFGGFINFLKAMRDFRSLHINLMNISVPQNLQRAKPLILDPTNPYNNLARQDPIVISTFVGAADLSLFKLTIFHERSRNSAVNSMGDLIKLIDPNRYYDLNM